MSNKSATNFRSSDTLATMSANDPIADILCRRDANLMNDATRSYCITCYTEWEVLDVEIELWTMYALKERRAGTAQSSM